jgi:CubicO group peptidase (beta-lactamase class C family)
VSSDRFAEADAVVAAATGTAFPGAVLAVGRPGEPPHERAFGRLSYETGAAEVKPDTIYDLASLTKVVATTTVAMMLVDEQKLDLDAPVARLLPRFRGGAKEAVSVRHLLSHSSGLPWWAPLYKEASGRREMLERLLALPLAYEPGTRSDYSDLGMVLLGVLLEEAGGAPLEILVRSRVTEPLGLVDTGYLPGPALVPRIAPTELDPWRGRLLVGEVHDENAFAFGGVAGHAGLFGTAGDLARFARMVLDGGLHEGRRLVSRATIELFTRRAGVPRSTRALGWDTAADEGGGRSSTPGDPCYSSAGSLLSPRSFGQTGFTGTSLWIDPDRGLYLVLLTNRVHPSRANDAIRAVRARLADVVAHATASGSLSARSSGSAPPAPRS